MDNYENYGIKITGNKKSGETIAICPKCSHTRSKKNQKVKCLGINLDKKVWHCNHCGWSGALRIEYNEKKTYEKPVWKNNTELSEKLVKWFESRGISQNTLISMKISEGKEFMQQVNKELNTIQFNYFKGEELVNIKYRDGLKNFKLYKGAERIFYNYDAIAENEEIYIVEGEMDVLSIIECGITNVISVPNGANLQTNNLEYLDSCIHEFNGKKIHLALDYDNAGRRLREELADRFGKYRCDYIEYMGLKDANECLVKYGKNNLIECLQNPKQFPLEGVFTISDFNNEIEDMYENGLDKGYDLGIHDFDLNIVKGYITTITGIPGHGKSEWVDNMALQLRIKHNCNGAFYSPENKPTELHFSKLARKLIGKHWEGQYRINHEEKNLVKRYLNEKMYFLKPEKDFTLKTILNQLKDLQQRKGLDYFVIDAWNKLEHKGQQDSDYIGRCLDDLGVFCEMNRIHCFLVAHPTKMPKNKETGLYEIPTLYNINGSANFYNKTDNGICVYRDKNTGISTVLRQKVKFDHWGSEGISEYFFDKQTLRYNCGNIFDKSNWITGDTVVTEYTEGKIKELSDSFLGLQQDNEPVPF